MAAVRIERRDDVAVMWFARPPANAFSIELVEEFHARLNELDAQVPSGGVVITGEGRMFSGGVDFKAVPTYSQVQRTRMVGHINGAITALYGLPTATVAAVNGHAIGGAFVVLLACDVRVVADTEAKLGLTEITAGIPYPACPMEVVKAEIEPSQRRHLVLSGETMGPQTAYTCGLVDELVPPDDLLRRAVEVARARSGARAYGRVKRQLRGDTLARMREIIAQSQDPMLARWI